MSGKRVAVVTGSNKGIGYAIVRALCKQFDGDVIMTSRDEGRGQEALKALQGEGLNPKFHQLDIDDSASITRLRNFLKEQYGGLDILVNNAGIAYKGSSTAPFAEQARVTIKTNFLSTLNACEQLFPLLRPHARVSNVSSFVSQMSIKKCSKEIQARFKDPALTMDGLKKLMNEFIRVSNVSSMGSRTSFRKCSEEIKARFQDPALTMDDLRKLMNEFTSLAQEDKHQAAGWPNSAYGVSKIGVTVMSMVQQRELDAQKKDDVIVNACCPGYVDTDMTSHKGTKTIDQGAETPVFIALIPPNASSPRGQFLSEKTVQQWG